MNIKPFAALVLAAGLVAFLPIGLAQLAEAGLSGQCYNADDTEGGQDEARAGTGDIVVLPGTVSDPTGQTDGYGGVVPALQEFGTESVNDGGQTGTACKRYDCFTASQCGDRPMRFDYLEVDGKIGDVEVQACYRGQVSVAGDCPKSPTGPGE